MGRDWDTGTVWRLHEYKGVNGGNILSSTPLPHTLSTTPSGTQGGGVHRRESTWVIVNKACHWGQVQDKVEGHCHPLSCGTGGTLRHLEEVTGISLHNT